METFTIDAEYAHTVIGRRAALRLGENLIPVTIDAATIDPDTGTVVIDAGIVSGTIPLRMPLCEPILVEAERTQ